MLKTSHHVITPKFKLELIVIRFFLLKYLNPGDMYVCHRVRTGHGKLGKSWNLSISDLIVDLKKSWKIIVSVVRR